MAHDVLPDAQTEPASPNTDQHAAPSTSPVTLFAYFQNAVLSSLPRQEFLDLSRHLELVWLSPGEQLFCAGSALEKVFFPLTAVISLLYVMADGATTEVAMIGREGMVGMALFAGERATSNAVVQSGGLSYSLHPRFLREAIARGGPLPERLMRYANVLMTQIASTTVGSQHSSIEQKLCRWLLDRSDRAGSNDMLVTHERIGLMLGVRRESITAAVRKLQREGAIQNRRGFIAVADRGALEVYAGECYCMSRLNNTNGGPAVMALL